MKSLEERILRKNQHKLYLIILSIVFFVIATYTTIWEINYYINFGGLKKTTATVVAHEYENDLKYDVISYDVDNVTYRKTTTYLSKNEINDKITIYYDEDNPAFGVVYSLDYRRIAYPIITVSLIFVTVGLIVVYNVAYRDIILKEKLKKLENKVKK